jgi:hypothetical protein
MAFDWIRFLDANRIEYATKGRNISSGNLVLHCPFCAHTDEGMHLSVSINNRGWRCFRQPDLHRGKSAARLVAALTGCSLAQAVHICGEQISIPDDFMGRLTELLSPAESVERKPTRMPGELKVFSNRSSCKPYIRYLRSRGFDGLPRFTRLFDVRYATKGFFHHRVVIPIRYQGRLVSLTGRVIHADAMIRYLTLPSNPEKVERWGIDPAQGPITDYLLFYDECLRADADTIFIVEGPMDAWKLWQLGLDQGMVAVAVFTSTASPAQIDKLHSLLPRFKNRYLLLDRNTLAISMRLQSQLHGLDVVNLTLPANIKDPGLLESTEQLMSLI